MIVQIIVILIDLIMVVGFGTIGILFFYSKGKGCNYIAGYNMKTTEERKNYDEKKIGKYFGKTILSWMIYFLVGAIIDYFKPGVGLITAIILWMIAFIYHMIHIRDKKFDEIFRIQN